MRFQKNNEFQLKQHHCRGREIFLPMEKPLNILVCTVKSWNSKVGDNTFPLLLEQYPKAHIASLFIREEHPDSPVCNRYFRISESRMMRSILHRGEKTGYLVPEHEPRQEEQPGLYAHKKRFYYTKLFCREIVWKLGKWKTKELEQFLADFAPDVVIYEMSRYIHLNHIVMYILQKTQAAGVGCFWDDTFTYKQENSLGYKALRFFQRRNLKKLAGKTHAFFAITPKTKKEADAFFGIDSTVLTKPIPAATEYAEPNYSFPLRMLYTGNVGIGRLEVLKLIVDELQKLNADHIRLTLEVYTNTPLSEEDRQQLQTDYSTVYPPVPQEEALKLQKEADILLFVESLGADNQMARLSFSTKITDYYAAGKCIFAVGNKDLAPMELFVENDSAVTAFSAEELRRKLHQLSDTALLTEYARKAFAAGQAHHSCDSTRKVFFGNALLWRHSKNGLTSVNPRDIIPASHLARRL